jgi:hypothetical protein
VIQSNVTGRCLGSGSLIETPEADSGYRVCAITVSGSWANAKRGWHITIGAMHSDHVVSMALRGH